MQEPVIKGWRVDRRLLTRASLRRCRLGECRGWCCGMGIWVDLEQQRLIMRHAEIIKPLLVPGAQDETGWFDPGIRQDAEYPSGQCIGTNRVPRPDHPVGEACVFLTADYRCALQVVDDTQAPAPQPLKPFYCALYPLTTDGHGRLGLDDTHELYIGGGTCQRVLLPLNPRPLHEVLAAELKLFLGDDGYQELVALAGSEENIKP